MTYEDGQVQTIVTSPDTWKYFNQGPVVYGSFFQGEVYDALREKGCKDGDRVYIKDYGFEFIDSDD